MNKKNSATELVQAEENKPTMEVWQFSPLDQISLHMVIRGTWLFAGRLDSGELKKGLEKLLSYYPHLAGRMKEPSGITFTNDGVPFTVVDNPALCLEDLYQRDDFTNIKEMSTIIKPGRLKKGLDAPLSVKLTRLKDGSVLGVQCSHACMDGDSFYTMIYNWGRICRKQEIVEPVLDQSKFPSPGELSKEEAEKAAIESGWVKMSLLFMVKMIPLYLSGNLKMRSRGFHIPAGMIDCIKERIFNETGADCTSNVALSALITNKCFELYHYDEEASCSQVTVVNCRGRLASLPHSFVGNASTNVVTPHFKAGISIADLAVIIDQTLEPIRQESSPKLQELLSVSLNAMKHKLPYAPFDVPGMHAKKPRVAYINNFSKLPIYELDFGTGYPQFVIPHDLMDQVVIWPAHPDKGGVEVYFSGIPSQMISKQIKEDLWLFS